METHTQRSLLHRRGEAAPGQPDDPISLTKLERRIAAYLSANPNALAVDNSATHRQAGPCQPHDGDPLFQKSGF